jgi:hypothetical protein
MAIRTDTPGSFNGTIGGLKTRADQWRRAECVVGSPPFDQVHLAQDIVAGTDVVIGARNVEGESAPRPRAAL